MPDILVDSSMTSAANADDNALAASREMEAIVSDHLPQPSYNSPLTAEESLTVSRTLGVITQLFILDDHWTRAAIAINDADSVDEAQLESLGKVVSEMDALLEQSRTILTNIAGIFRTHADDMRSTYAILVGETPASSSDTGRRHLLTDEERQMLRDVVDKVGGGDIARMAVQAAERASTTERVATERQALNLEFRKLADGHRSEGDMSQEQWAELAMVAAGASVLFGPEAGPVVMGAGALADLAYGLLHSLFG